MNPALDPLIQSLRDELQQYGEMLALLDHQQEYVVTRSADDMLQTAAEIQAQTGIIERARADRDQRRRELALFLCQAPDAPFADLIPLLPEEYRPLLQALVDENNQLLHRVQQRARQNHVLLNRSVDLMKQFMNALMPSLRPTIYTGSGALYGAAMPGRTLYEAVG
jgi:flagellar biosynthesis/type III secretory pathway chaperone